MEAVQPKIYLVSKPNVDWGVFERFLVDEGLPELSESIKAVDDAEGLVEASARLCYHSYAKGRKDIKDFIDNLLASKDGSVFEHVYYGFLITGISRSLSHEFVRHRAGFAYSQRSQRYVDESSANYILPPLLERNFSDEQKAAYEGNIKMQVELYNSLVDENEDLEELRQSHSVKPSDRRKKVRSAARSVLPNAMETKMFVTANVRAWRHFIEMRGHFADEEIRRLAIMILRVLQKEAPLFFGDFTIRGYMGGVMAFPKYSKV